MKNRKRIWYGLVALLATSAILGFACAYVFLPPPKGSLAEVKWQYNRDAARINARFNRAKSEAERKAVTEGKLI